MQRMEALKHRLEAAGGGGALFVGALEQTASNRTPVSFHTSRPLAGEGEGAFIVTSGIVCTERHLANGSRQIGEIFQAGDIIQLSRWRYPRSPWSLFAAGSAELLRVAKHDWDALLTKIELVPIFEFIARIHAARAAERLTSLGRRDAMERVAHLLCELWVRGDQAGLVQSGVLPFPLTQADIGDATGLTAVHINRTLQRLRREIGVGIGSQILQISDFARLSEVSRFDPAYLLVEAET